MRVHIMSTAARGTAGGGMAGGGGGLWAQATANSNVAPALQPARAD